MERREAQSVTQTGTRMHGMETGHSIDKGSLKGRLRAETVESSLRIMKCSRSTMRNSRQCAIQTARALFPMIKYTALTETTVYHHGVRRQANTFKVPQNFAGFASSFKTLRL